jgi:hypothetical protein
VSRIALDESEEMSTEKEEGSTEQGGSPANEEGVQSTINPKVKKEKQLKKKKPTTGTEMKKKPAIRKETRKKKVAKTVKKTAVSGANTAEEMSNDEYGQILLFLKRDDYLTPLSS